MKQSKYEEAVRGKKTIRSDLVGTGGEEGVGVQSGSGPTAKHKNRKKKQLSRISQTVWSGGDKRGKKAVPLGSNVTSK